MQKIFLRMVLKKEHKPLVLNAIDPHRLAKRFEGPLTLPLSAVLVRKSTWFVIPSGDFGLPVSLWRDHWDSLFVDLEKSHDGKRWVALEQEDWEGFPHVVIAI